MQVEASGRTIENHILICNALVTLLVVTIGYDELSEVTATRRKCTQIDHTTVVRLSQLDTGRSEWSHDQKSGFQHVQKPRRD